MLPGTFYSKVQLPNALPGTIRLLTVTSDLERKHVVCQWATTTLDHAPLYWALSYTWQSPLLASAATDTSVTEPTHEIVLNGDKANVYHNLFHALLRLGQPPYRNKPIWIDYICIDQSNTEERNHQGDLMGDICKQADQVIIWLGEEDQYVDAASFKVLAMCTFWLMSKAALSKGLGITGHKRYWAAGNIARYLDFPDPSTIRLEGSCIARINMQGEPRQEVSRKSASSFPSWVEIIPSLGKTYDVTNEPILEASWRTLVYDTGDDRQYPAREAIGSSFYAWLSQTAKATNLKHLASDQQPAKSSHSLWKVCISHSGLLRLFRTDEGFLGLGSESLQVGDEIWIVAGSRIPSILRKRDATPGAGGMSRYELVGGAYLHGFMHGEALQEGTVNNGQRKPFEFEFFDVV